MPTLRSGCNEDVAGASACGGRPVQITAATRLGCSSGRFFLDRRADQITPLGPRAIVVAHLWVTEKVLQHEPGEGTTFTDTAIGDHLVLAADPFAGVELLERIGGVLIAVLLDPLRPRHVDRAGGVPAPVPPLVPSPR